MDGRHLAYPGGDRAGRTISSYASMADGALWVVFLLDFLIRFTLAPRKAVYLRHNILTAASLVVPALRMLRLTALIPALRAARGLKLARLVGGVNRTMFSLRSLTTGSGFQYVLLLTVAVILVGAAGIDRHDIPVSDRRNSDHREIEHIDGGHVRIVIILQPVALDPQDKEDEREEGRREPDTEQQRPSRPKIGTGKEDLVEQAA